MLGKGEKRNKFNLWPDPVGHFGPPGGHLELFRLGGAGGEQVPPAPLGWYFVHILSDFNALKKESI